VLPLPEHRVGLTQRRILHGTLRLAMLDGYAEDIRSFRGTLTLPASTPLAGGRGLHGPEWGGRWLSLPPGPLERQGTVDGAADWCIRLASGRHGTPRHYSHGRHFGDGIWVSLERHNPAQRLWGTVRLETRRFTRHRRIAPALAAVRAGHEIAVGISA
jgi:hypothetical protein